MNELDLLLAEIVEASRYRRQQMRATPRGGRRDKINLARPVFRPGSTKTQAATA